MPAHLPPFKKKRKANLQLGPPSPAPHSLCAGWGVQGCLACSAQQNISLLLCWRELEFSTSSNAQRRGVATAALFLSSEQLVPNALLVFWDQGFEGAADPSRSRLWCTATDAQSSRFLKDRREKKKHVKENAKGTVPFENRGRVWTLKCDASVLKSGCRLSKQYRKCLPQNWIYFLNFWLNDVLII